MVFAMDKRIELEKSVRRRRIAEEISDALRASGMSRKEFANKMGRHPSEVTKWLSGDHNFTSDLLAEISAVLLCPISGAKERLYPRKDYEGKDSNNCLRDPMWTIGTIDLPEETLLALIAKANDAGMSLREYVRRLLCAKAAERSVTAYDFKGIWSYDGPDVEEIRSFRGFNSIKEL